MNSNDRLSKGAHRLASSAAENMPHSRPRHVEVDTVVMSASKLLREYGIDAHSVDPELLKGLRLGFHVAIDCQTRCIVGLRVERISASEARLGTYRHVFKWGKRFQNLESGSHLN